MEKTEVKKILLVVLVGFVVTVASYLLLSYFIVSSQSGVLEQAVKSNKMQDEIKAKESKTNSTENSGYINDQEKNFFNMVFKAYEGEQRGNQIKLLISSVESSNEIYEDRKIEINYLDDVYEDSKFSDLKKDIDNEEEYYVSFEYDSKGIIHLITIEREKV